MSHKATGLTIELLTQQLLDSNVHSRSCDGGYIHTVFNWVVNHGGLQTNMDYPYYGFQMEPQSNYPHIYTARISNYRFVENDEYNLAEAVIYNSVGVTINVDQTFQNLGHGNIFRRHIGPDPNRANNHCVTIVGFGVEWGEPYWSIKNSWGMELGILDSVKCLEIMDIRVDCVGFQGGECIR